MNSVSWFLYFTNVVGNISVLFLIFLIVGIVSAGIMTLVGAMKRDMAFGDKNDIDAGLFLQYTAIKVGIVCAILSLFLALLPSKQTMYMIAASQVGEQIIQLEEVQDIGGEAGGLAKDAIELLRQQIQEQLTAKPVEGEN